MNERWSASEQASKDVTKHLTHMQQTSAWLAKAGKRSLFIISYLTVQCRFSRLNVHHSQAPQSPATDPATQGSNGVRRYIGLGTYTGTLPSPFPFASP
jgi:hypothetical protein